MVTIEEIHAYLGKLTPLDELYKKYYIETGHLLPIDQLDDFLKRNPLSLPRPSPLSFLDPAYHGDDYTAVDFSADPASLTQRFRIRNGVYFNSSEGITIRKHNNYFPSFCHTHGFMEVCIVLKGQCRHEFYSNLSPKEHAETVAMAEDDVLVIPPGLYHTVDSLTDSVILNILVKRSAIEKTISQFLAEDVPLFSYFTKIIYENKIDSFLLFHLGKDPFLDNLLDQLLLEYCNRPPLYLQIMSQILGLYFSYIQRSHGNKITVANTAPTGADYIPQFLLYLQSHYADFSMTRMTERFHLSASYISRIFKANVGHTILEILTGIRLETAKRLLQNTSLFIDDIAINVGYEDTTYFIRTFKKKFAMTPLCYRKNSLSGRENTNTGIPQIIS